MKYHTSTYTPPHFNLLYSTSIIYEEKNFDLNCHTSTYSPHLYLKYHTSTFTIHSKAIPHLRYTVHEIPHLNRCTTPQSTIPLIHFFRIIAKNHNFLTQAKENNCIYTPGCKSFRGLLSIYRQPIEQL